MQDKICCFDGSRRTYDTQKREKIREIIIKLIEKEGVKKFCFIRKSRIEGAVMPILKQLKALYPDIRIGIVYPNTGNELKFLKETVFKEYDFFLTDTIAQKTSTGWEIKSWGHYMVDCSSHMICCTDSKTGKSADTLFYAKGKGNIKYLIFWKIN